MYRNEHGAVINHMHVEREEQVHAERFITPECVVLELGARYGTVSCVISKKLSNSNNLVAVEPDERVWAALEDNMARNGCNFHILKGFISRRPLALAEKNSWEGYGTTSINTNDTSIASFTLEEVEARYGLTFNTLVADCEGFLEVFLDENPKLYDTLSLILFEKDYPHKCNYNKIIATLRAKGFRQLISGFHEVWKK